MRKLVWILLAVMLLSSVVVLAAVEQNITKAVPCTDSDNGPGDKNKADPYIGVLGFVKYGISTDKSDECVSNKEGFHKDPSIWVREYFCAGNPMMLQHEDYDCTHYGYTSCQGGKCIGKSNASSTVSHATATEPACGNHKLDSGEQCDPPDKICYVGSKVGVCSRPNPTTHFGGCQCNIYEKGSSTTSSGTTAPPAEKPPVEQPPAEQPPATVPPATQPPAAEQPPSAPPAETTPAAQPERQPLPTEELPPAKGIGVTRAITNSVKHFFSWIGSWFH